MPHVQSVCAHLKEVALFAKNELLHPLENASVIPSSRRAANAMVRGIDFSCIQTIIELGPGTGAFTHTILERCRPDTTVILLETNTEYVELLKKKYGTKIIIEETSAENLDIVLANHHITYVDLIVSGLPFLKDSASNILIKSLRKHLQRGTVIRFFTYMPFVARQVYRELPFIKRYFVGWNFPPLWVCEFKE